MGKLSIFIDESGDFGEIKERPAYYLVTFVFHDQNKNIDKQVLKLEESVKAAGFDVEHIHTGPVIRREEIFAGYSIDERRKLLYKMLNFVNACVLFDYHQRHNSNTPAAPTLNALMHLLDICLRRHYSYYKYYLLARHSLIPVRTILHPAKPYFQTLG